MTVRAAVLRIAHTSQLTADELRALSKIFEDAFQESSAEYWTSIGAGLHFFLAEDGVPVSQACVIERSIHADQAILRTGYVEAVCTRPDRESSGLATRVVRAVTHHVRARFEFGGLSTGSRSFYKRFGWETWPGPSAIRMPDGSVTPTPEEDGGIMILRTRTTPALDMRAQITCAWRAGEVW